jgi:hypothetical protein
MKTAKNPFIVDVRNSIDAGQRLIDGVSTFNEMNADALEELEAA